MPVYEGGEDGILVIGCPATQLPYIQESNVKSRVETVESDGETHVTMSF
jgi:coenzyme F420-reducing hydrogenase delta subunit